MKLNKSYTIIKDDLIEAIDFISEFQEKLDRFKLKHSQYNYDIKLNQEEDKWKIEIDIRNEQENNTQTSATSVRSRSVL